MYLLKFKNVSRETLRKRFASETLAPSAVGKADKIQYARVYILPEGLLLHKKSVGISYAIK